MAKNDSNGVKTTAAAIKWLKQIGGAVIDDNSKEGKWAAYIPSNDKDGMAIYYGNTIVEAINNAIQDVEG